MGRVAKIAQEGQLKRCPKCELVKPLKEYNKGNGQFGRRSICRDCEKIIQNTPERKLRRRELEIIRRQNPEYVILRNNRDKLRRTSNINSIKMALLRSAKVRALKRDLEFNIGVEDFDLPEKCPLLNISLTCNLDKAKDNSYSLDRIDNSKGYIKGNVWIISNKANRLKGDASLEELEFLTKNLRYYWIH